MQTQSNTAVVVNLLDRIAEDARYALRKIHFSEENTMKYTLMLGVALNKGRRQFKSDELFGKWLFGKGLSQVAKDDRVAAMWAAEDLKRFNEVKKANPRVRTVRGLHAKWKQPEPKTEKETATHAELSMMRKLHVMATHESTDPGTKENAQRKLDDYCERFGVDQQSLVEREDKPNAVGMTRREMKNAIAETLAKNSDHVKFAAFIRSVLEAAYDDEQLEYQLNVMKGVFA